MKTLKQVVSAADWEHFFARFAKLYPTQEHNRKKYRLVFQKLKEMEPYSSARFLIDIRLCASERGRFQVAGLSVGTDRDLRHIDLADWAEWLAMTFTATTNAFCPDIDKVVHSVYAMTTYGYSADRVQSSRIELEESITNNGFKDIDNRIYAPFS